jgi:cob(I)alamin adenosyltransferase
MDEQKKLNELKADLEKLVKENNKFNRDNRHRNGFVMKEVKKYEDRLKKLGDSDDASGMLGGAFTILAAENLTKVLLVICILLILYILYLLYNHIQSVESGEFSQSNVYPSVQCPN